MYSPADLPSSMRAAPAKKRRLSAENGISSRDAINGLPTLTDSSCASSSAFSSITSASLCRSSDRSFGVFSSHSRVLLRDLGSFLRLLREPLRECLVRRVDCAVDIVGAAARHLGDHL